MIDVKKIGRLANLATTDDEEKKYRLQLEDTLNHIGNLNEIDTDNIEGTYQVTGKQNAMREDVVDLKNCLSKKVYAIKQIIPN
jgi:aspartyl-tRNA(Asn)/glutamyl-tRNA(Gln) amidotransferase subunit C